jgi:3-keto-5-aminohexanoate cleavage enzyme
MANKPLVIIVAVNGGARKSSGDIFVPTTPQEIADEAALCARAGASVLHFHGRDANGDNTGDPAVYADIIRRVREKADILLQSTNGIGDRVDPVTGARVFPDDEERLALMRLNPPPDFHGAATASIDFYNPDGGYEGESSFPNSGRFLKETIRIVYGRGSTIEFEVPHVTALHRLHRILTEEGVDPASKHIMMVTPIFGGFVPDLAQFTLLQAEAKRLFPNVIRSAGAAGKMVFPLVTLGIALGFECVRVGFEDTIYMPDESTAKRNFELVEKVVEIAKLYGRRPATAAEARSILQLDRNRTAR